MDDDARALRVLDAFCVIVAIVLAGLILLCLPANGQEPAPSAKCTASGYTVLNAKTKKPEMVYRASCTVTRGESVLFVRSLVLPVNATRREALNEIERWMDEDLPKLLEEKKAK